MLRKLLFNRGSVAPLLITIVAVVLFYRVSHVSDVYVRLAEAFFQTALISLLLGLCCIVRNGGLFKGLTYIRYRIHKKNMRKQKEKNISADEREENFAQFINERYSKKWVVAPYFIFSSVYILMYIALLIFTNY